MEGANNSEEGNLLGIIEKLDYIKEAGFNGIYLTSNFESTNQHSMILQIILKLMRN